MDTDLFQGVLLGLLAVGIIVLIALLATLGGIRKALEERSAGRAVGADRDTGPSAAPEPGEQTQATPTETGPVSGYTGAGSYATPITQEASPAQQGGRADSIRSVLEQHGVGGAEEQAAATPEAQEPVVDSAFAAHADDPQEEPFQRDGRWWFRRGDELLLYDEASGQWQPAPEGEPSAGAASATGPTPARASGSTTQTQNMPAVADQVATYWKCPTCGAVNGSTAATCRMCFAARP